jgi:DNA polymerase-1
MTPITDLIGKGKAQITMDRVPIEDASPYACADADMTLRLVKPLTQDLHERKQWALLTEIEMPMIPILIQMETAGVGMDTGYLEQMSEQLRAEQARIEGEIYDLAGHTFMVNSTKQLSQVLFEELGLPKRGIRKTVHGYSTAADALELLKGKHPIIDLIQQQRQVSKLESTYVRALPKLVNPHTGRVHTSYNQTGTVTGRLSSSNPNLQNIPIRTELGRQIRKAFVPRPGWVFLAADYSQVELRILAHVSQDPELLDAFARDQDVHARTAAAVYGVPLAEVTKEQRGVAKTVNFGLIYGQSAFGLAGQTGLDFDEAERFIARYFERYPGVQQWLDQTRELARERGYVETLRGRRRYFPELQSTRRAFAGRRAAAQRQAINAPIQGTAADILKIAMIRLDRELTERKLAARMVLQVHDEVVLEVPKDELDEVSALTRAVMEQAYKLDVPLKVDAEVGENWFDMHGI